MVRKIAWKKKRINKKEDKERGDTKNGKERRGRLVEMKNSQRVKMHYDIIPARLFISVLPRRRPSSLYERYDE